MDRRHFPRPRDYHEIQRFLSLSGFFLYFVPGYASLASPLHKFLLNDQLFTWENEQEYSFDKLKNILANEPVLQPFDAKRRTELHTDANTPGLGGVKLQQGIVGI